MTIKSTLAVALCLAWAASVPGALALDSEETERAPKVTSDYQRGVKEVKAGNYAAALPLLQKAIAKNEAVLSLAGGGADRSIDLTRPGTPQEGEFA